MQRRMTLAGAGLAALAASALAITPAMAQKKPADNGPRIVVKGGTKFTPGVSVTDDQRFVGVTTVRSGGTVRIVNQAKTQDPHTITVLRKRDLPASFADLETNEAIGAIMGAHQVPQDGSGPPAVPLVNAGAEGFDQPGDSLFFAGKSAKLTVTAKKGTTLHYICLIHPWMQGKIKVR